MGAQVDAGSADDDHNQRSGAPQRLEYRYPLLDRRLLENVILKFKGGPVGLDTIATSLSEEPETVEDVHEPYLIQIGFLARTARGRVATELAYRHLGITPPTAAAEQTRLL